jgi:hypothetical protein
MQNHNWRTIVRLTVTVFFAAVLSGCATYYPGYASDDIWVDYYTPQFYDGYPVYFDRVGVPFYYRGERIVYVPRSYRRYRDLTVHYKRHRPHYHRWYDERGHRYRHVHYKHPSRKDFRRVLPPADPDTRYRRVPQRPPLTEVTPDPRRRYQRPTPPPQPDIRYKRIRQPPPVTVVPPEFDPRDQQPKKRPSKRVVQYGGQRPVPGESDPPRTRRDKTEPRTRDARQRPREPFGADPGTLQSPGSLIRGGTPVFAQ